MVQLFRCNEFSERFDRWTGTVKDFQAAMFLRMKDELPSSVTFGYFVWDNNLSDLVPFFTRDYFAQNFEAILEAFKIAGTFEAYLIVIRSALGQDTVVTFDVPSPSHLIINITNPTGFRQFSAYTEDQLKDVIPDQIQYPDSTFVFFKSVANLTVNETAKLIELLNVTGVFVEVNFQS